MDSSAVLKDRKIENSYTSDVSCILVRERKKQGRSKEEEEEVAEWVWCGWECWAGQIVRIRKAKCMLLNGCLDAIPICLYN